LRFLAGAEKQLKGLCECAVSEGEERHAQTPSIRTTLLTEGSFLSLSVRPKRGRFTKQ